MSNLAVGYGFSSDRGVTFSERREFRYVCKTDGKVLDADSFYNII